MSAKICKKCGVEKPVEEFSFANRNKSAHRRANCKPCCNSIHRDGYAKNPKRRDAERAASKKWKKNNPEKVWEQRLRNNYGLTIEQYDKAFKDQNACCAICGDFLTRSHVDHDHQSGKFRGILCITCNTGLGKFGDSIELLQKAVQYLQKFLG